MTGRRVGLSVAAVVTVLCGLTISTAFAGFAADAAADALYTVLIYLLVSILFPRSRKLLTAAVAFAFSAVIEFAQLTGLPAALSDAFAPARLVFGTTFVATDLIFYLVGAAAAASVDALATRLARSGRRDGT